MGWWPFGKKKADFTNDPQVKGTRTWLDDLRMVCERHHDNPAAGQIRVRELQIEWRDAHAKQEVSPELLEGLDRRAFYLLRADVEEWLSWLDDDAFWKPGWRWVDSE